MTRVGQLFPEPIATLGNVATSNANLTANVLVVGAGGNGIASLGSTGNTTTVLHGSANSLPSYSAVVEGDLSLSNVTTWDVSISRHGFAPRLPNNASVFLDGTGAYTAPAGSGNGVTSTSNTSTTNGIPVWASATGSSIQDINLSFSTDGTFASPSNVALPTTQAVVTYVNSKLSPFQPLTAPVFANYSWVNQGAATAGVSNGELWLTQTGTSGNNVRLLKVASPGAAFTATIAVQMPMAVASAYNDKQTPGLWLYDSVGGKLLGFYPVIDTANSQVKLLVDEFNTTTSFQGNLLTNSFWAPVWNHLIWLRIVDDGTTNRTFYVSPDGLNWIQVLQHARTTWITSPNSIAFGNNIYAGTLVATAICWSWKVTSP